MKLLSVLVFSIWLSVANSYKILGIFPFGSKSHFAIGNGVMNSLLDAGHQITMVSPFPRSVKTVNWRDISLTTEGYEGDKIRILITMCAHFFYLFCFILIYRTFNECI